MPGSSRHAIAAGLGLAAFAVLAWPHPAAAQNLAVSADIVSGCALRLSSQTTGIDMGSLAFGTVPAVRTGTVSASVVVAGGGTMQFECTPGLSAQITVDGGLHLSGSQRRMGRNGGNSNLTNYALYADSGHAIPLGINTARTVTVPAGGVIDLPIFGVATLPGPGAVAGTYTDTLQVTVSW